MARAFLCRWYQNGITQLKGGFGRELIAKTGAIDAESCGLKMAILSEI